MVSYYCSVVTFPYILILNLRRHHSRVKIIINATYSFNSRRHRAGGGTCPKISDNGGTGGTTEFMGHL